MVAIPQFPDAVSKDRYLTQLSWPTAEPKLIPTFDDICGLTLHVVGQCDSGSAVSKKPYNPFPIIKRVRVYGNGGTILIDLLGRHLRAVHRVAYDVDPEYVATPDTDSQSNQAFSFDVDIPLQVYKDTFQQLQVEVEWGAEADLDAGSGFNVDSVTCDILINYGKIERENRIIFQQDTGTGMLIYYPILGITQLSLLVDEDGIDTQMDRIQLYHEGDEKVSATWNQLKGKSQLNDRSGFPIAGIRAIGYPGFLPSNNSYLQATAGVSTTLDLVMFYLTAIGTPRSGNLGYITKVPLDNTDRLKRAFPNEIARDLILGNTSAGVQKLTVLSGKTPRLFFP